MNMYENVGEPLQLPDSHVAVSPTLVTARILMPPPRGAIGGLSLPSMNSRISGAATLTKPLLEPLRHSSPDMTSTVSMMPTKVGVDPSVSPLPLSPLQPEPAVAL